MKKLIIIFCLPLLVYSQQTEKIGKKKIHEINWQTNIFYESNSLNKNFLDKIIYGGYIDDLLKEEWLESNDQEKILNTEIINQITYTNHKYNYSLEISDKNSMNLFIQEDLMRIILYGNYDYQNQEISLANTKVLINRYQQYKLKYLLDLSPVKINTGFSFLSGNFHHTSWINNGSIYTNSNGNYLDLSYDFTSITTDTTDYSPFKNNGNGLALDFSISIEKNNYKTNIYISDLGFIMWNNKTLISSNDSNFLYQGIQVDNILEFHDSIVNTQNIYDETFKNVNNSFKSYIPANFGVNIHKDLSLEKLNSISGGVNMRWQPLFDNTPLSFQKISQGILESNYKPYLWVSTNSPTKYFDLISHLSYGGYISKINIGLSLAKDHKNNTFIVGTNHLESIINGNKSKAMSLQIRFLINL